MSDDDADSEYEGDDNPAVFYPGVIENPQGRFNDDSEDDCSPEDIELFREPGDSVFARQLVHPPGNTNLATPPTPLLGKMLAQIQV